MSRAAIWGSEKTPAKSLTGAEGMSNSSRIAIHSSLVLVMKTSSKIGTTVTVGDPGPVVDGAGIVFRSGRPMASHRFRQNFSSRAATTTYPS